MSFGEKFRSAIFKIKNKIAAFFLMWLVVACLGVTTFSIAIKNASTANGDDSISSQAFFMAFDYIMKPHESVPLALSDEYKDVFWPIFWRYNIIYFIAMVIGDGAVFRGSDSLLQLPHLRCQCRLISYRRRHSSQQRRNL